MPLLVWYLTGWLLSTPVNECSSNWYLNPSYSEFLPPMLLPLLVGDQRRLVLLLLSLPQQPLLVRLDAPTCASTGVYKIN